MPWSHIAEPSWCNCGGCYKAPTEDESICCGASPCRSKEFKEYLEGTLTESYLNECEGAFFNALSTDAKLIYGNLSSPGKLRRMCYKEASAFFHERLWYPQNNCEKEIRVALPSCVVWAIRRQFEEEDGRYTGYPPKPELLQEVVNDRMEFETKMEMAKSVVHMANPDGGLLTTLQSVETEKQIQMIYFLMTPSYRHLRKQWTESMATGNQMLPSMGFLPCSTAFEVFVHAAIQHCVEKSYRPTTKVRYGDDETWMEIIGKWLDSRSRDAEFLWCPNDHKYEAHFWAGIVELGITVSGRTTKNVKPLLEKLNRHKKQILQYLHKRPMEQESVGLVRSILLNLIQQSINTKLKWPTVECIEEAFVEILRYNLEVKMCGQPLLSSLFNKKRKMRTERKDSPSHPRSKSGSTSDSYTLSDRTCFRPISPDCTMITPSFSANNTPPGKPESWPKSRKAVTSRTSGQKHASMVKYFINHYASKYSWQIWINGTFYDVQCRSLRGLRYLSNLF